MKKKIQSIKYIIKRKRFNVFNISGKKKDSGRIKYQNSIKIQ